MTGDALLVYAILAGTILLFASNRVRLDLVAILSLLALALTGVLTPSETLAGFSDPAVVMIAGLFVVGGGMLRTGLAERVGWVLGRVAGTGRARATLVLMLGTGTLSAFMSTTGTVALLLPVTMVLARGAGLSPSLLLMPMAIGALLGGLLTLVASPPNIIVSNQLAAAGLEPFHFFDFTPVGLVLLAVGTAVLTLFGGRLLPARAPAGPPASPDGVAKVPGEELVSGYAVGPVVRLRVVAGSPIIGSSPATAEVRQRYGVNVVAIRRPHGRRGQQRRLPRTAEEPLRAGDELDVHGGEEAVERLRVDQRLQRIGEERGSNEVLAEVLIPPRSRLVGQTLRGVRFRSRYGVNVLSLRRQGTVVAGDPSTEPLRFADLLLVTGSPQRIDLLRGEGGDFVVIARTQEARGATPLSRAEWSALAIIAGMILLLALELVPPATAVLLAAVGMVLAGCLDMTAAYQEINWATVILVAAILPMATALQKTGGVELIVALMRPLAAAGPVAMLAATFVLTSLVGTFISNTATAALLAPIALGISLEMGVSPYPFLLTVAVAAAASFLTPVSTPANTLILEPGEYRFADYVRVGLPLQLVCGVLTILIVPLLFPF